jgi:hypothetical protein
MPGKRALPGVDRPSGLVSAIGTRLPLRMGQSVRAYACPTVAAGFSPGAYVTSAPATVSRANPVSLGAAPRVPSNDPEKRYVPTAGGVNEIPPSPVW